MITINKLRENLVSINRPVKQFIALSIDFLLITLSFLFPFIVLETDIKLNFIDFFSTFFVLPLCCILIFYFFGIYRSVLRFIDFSAIYLLVKAIIAILLCAFLFNYFLILFNSSVNILIFKSEAFSLSFQSWIIGILFSIILIIGIRLFGNFLLSDINSSTKVAIFGAGSAGIQLAGALRLSKEMQPVAFIDSNKSLHGSFIGGLRVLNPKKLKNLIYRNKIDEVLIAIPSASKSTLKKLLTEIEEYSVKVRILPGLAELAQGKISVSELKEVDVSDLLGREEVEPDQNLLKKNIENKVVLITGAGGSIGSEISRQVVRNNPKKVILLDSSEYALFLIKNELTNLYPEKDIYGIITNVTNKNRMEDVFKSFKVQTVYHAAAYKHVSLVEENPFEAIFNNIIGTKISAEVAITCKAETFVLISTDKAVRPTNIMGATKRFAEMILQSLAMEYSTKLSIVRFGNVLGSSGSAIPLFQKQIKEGGPITVTHPEVIRYFMSIPEAAELVLQAGAMGEGGDVFVLDMGEPVKIIEIAKKLINLSGMTLIDKKNLDGDIEIKFTGLRPGEKLFEELLIGDNVSKTAHLRILKAQEEFLSYLDLENHIEALKVAEKTNDVALLKEILEEAIDGFKPEKEIVDVLHLQKHS